MTSDRDLSIYFFRYLRASKRRLKFARHSSNAVFEEFVLSSLIASPLRKPLFTPGIGEILRAGQELDNAVDKLAVEVVQNNETVGHLPCEYLRILWLSHVVEKLLQAPVRSNGDSL